MKPTDALHDEIDRLRFALYAAEAEAEAAKLHLAALTTEKEKIDAELTAEVMKLIDDSHKRQAEYEQLRKDVLAAAGKNKRVLAERTIVVQVLRKLAQVCSLVGTANIPDRFMPAWRKAMTDTGDVLKLIEQAEQHRTGT